VNFVPFPTWLSKFIVPPCASMTRLQTASPKPCPRGLVVNRGVKIWFFIWSEIPMPVSSMDSVNLFSGLGCADMVSVPGSGMA